MTVKSSLKALSRGERVVLLAAILMGIAIRLAQLTGPIDDNASAWRQAETAYMTFRLAEETPPEILHSKVPYRGPYEVHLAEFPLQPFLTALLYKLVGQESLLLARLVTLAFFLGAAWLLYLCLARAMNERVGWYAMAMYLALPIGVDYSRAIHTDFCTIFFSHMYLLAGMIFLDIRKWRFWLVSCIAASLAFLMKAPYCFYLAIPLGVYRLQKNRDGIVKDTVLVAALFIIPLLLATLYNGHRIALESGYTESLVYHSKWTSNMAREWFFGTWADRLDWGRWANLLKRCLFDVLTPFGAVLAVWGLFVRRPVQDSRGWSFSAAWCAGGAVYVLTIFKIVSSHHEYYVLPLLAPAAILMAIASAYLYGKVSKSTWLRTGLLAVLFGLVWTGSLYTINRQGGFRRDWQRIMAGGVMEVHTDPSDIIVSVTKGRSTGKSDPRILYYAHRRGWPIEFDRLTEQALAQYRDAGATHAGLLLAPWFDPVADEYGALADFENTVHELFDPAGTPIGHLALFDLGASRNGAQTVEQD